MFRLRLDESDPIWKIKTKKQNKTKYKQNTKQTTKINNKTKQSWYFWIRSFGWNRIVQVQHLPYSPDPLALGNIFLFSKLKILCKAQFHIISKEFQRWFGQ